MYKKYVFLLTTMISFTGFFVTAQIDQQLVTDSLIKFGNYSKAIDHLNKIESLTSDQKKTLAGAYYQIGNYPESIKLLEEIVQSDSSDVHSLYELGKIYLKLSRTELAEQVFSHLIDVQGDNPNFHYNLSKIKQVEKDSSFVEDLRQAIKYDPYFVSALEDLAKYHIQINQPDSALYYSNLGLKRFKENPTLIGYKGQIYYNLGKDSLSVIEYEKLLNLGYEAEHIYKRLAISQFNQRNVDKALDYATKLLEYNDNNPQYHYLIGEIYQDKQEFDTAIYHYKKSLELKKVSNANEYLRLVEIYKERKELKKAIDYYTLLVGEMPDYSMGYYQIAFLADNYFKDPEIRIYHYKKFLGLAPKNMEMYVEYAQKRVSELREEIHFNSQD